MVTRIRKLAFALGLALGFSSLSVFSASYPTKPLRMIVPWSPGGGSDVTGRIVATKLSEIVGQPVIVDNRPGAAGNIGTAVAARAEADGYTLLLADTGFSTGISLYANPGYHPVKDFAPITLVAVTPIVAVVKAALPVANMRELIALAKQKPGGLNGGSGGIGGSVHLALELFKLQTGVNIAHVPYKGSGPAAVDLAGGQLDLMLSTAPPIMPLIKSGKVRALAVASSARSTLFPDLPTMKEAGAPEVIATNWYGILSPAGTPTAVLERLHQEFTKITALPDVKPKFAAVGLEPASNPTPQAFGKFVSDDVSRWASVIKQANIKLE
ncbi:MAG: tripartite tricarboxylate transporter substrate binding protein [Burkholderiales bacterium]|nr:tripartite tricarboxylate transporter substrate binding protein [Burkholderiales bacterium]